MTTTEWQLAEFTEDRELGRGAQGRVVLAHHTTSGVPVAIKYLAGSDPRAVEHLRSEAQMLGRLTSPYVARLYRFTESRYGAAIVMEAINGVSLKEILREHGSLTPEAALLVLKGSLLGLAAAHAVGVVHRDYKPANVVVQPDGLSKLVDFGVAVLSGQGSAAGTPLYMAPEQWRGEPATPATDVYAATAVFFECVTGRRPFTGADRLELMNQHLTAPVDLGDVPEPLRPLVTEGMAKDPGERPPGAAAFVNRLEAAATAAYGDDWEGRGLRALAAAAVALAALFPLGALAVPTTAGAAAGAGGAGAAGTASAAGASGAAGAGGAGSSAGTVGASVSKGFFATAAGKGTLAAAGAAVVATTAGGTLYAVRDTTEPPPRPNPVVTLASDNRTLNAGPATIRINGARYPRVTGLRNAELERRVNAELRGPIDRLIQEARNAVEEEGLNCGGRPINMGTETRLGARGPRLVSVRYFLVSDWCRQADGSPGGEVITVDLRTGRRLGPRDVFRPGTLTPAGVRRLESRVKQAADADAERWRRCAPEGFQVADFFPRDRDGAAGNETNPPYLSAFFMPGEFRITFLQPGSDGCTDIDFTAPYANVRDLLKPEIMTMVSQGPSPRRT
ncbi:MAG TPA: serine/threonine-protein kinase [Spirillospora sp.]